MTHPAVSEAIMGRPPHELHWLVALESLTGSRALVTGAAGSVGARLVPWLESAGLTVWDTDRATVDVTDPPAVIEAVEMFAPDIVFHLAGAKHAPACEEDPAEAVNVNVLGTRNVLDAVAGRARVVTASTCKACNPETAYGASKLLAERLTLNAGGTVARFFNVIETAGNVFDTWMRLPADAPIPWTDCHRYFITLSEAVALTIWAATLDPGRYVLDPGVSRWMGDVADAAYPDREHVEIPRRRGDRATEPLRGTHERVEPWPGLPCVWRVSSPHDQMGDHPNAPVGLAGGLHRP